MPHSDQPNEERSAGTARAPAPLPLAIGSFSANRRKPIQNAFSAPPLAVVFVTSPLLRRPIKTGQFTCCKCGHFICSLHCTFKGLSKQPTQYILAIFGSAKLTGGAPGLQIRCGGVKAFPGGFDSHALPPPYKTLHFHNLL